jgi:hypothetical protein
MRQAIDHYLAMRQAAGFDLVNAEYLLRSFARVAAERGETHVRATRLVPLHDTMQAGLDRYLTCRQHMMSNTEHVFVTDDGCPLRYREVYPTFQTVLKLAGLLVVSGHRPRLHELRHICGSSTGGQSGWSATHRSTHGGVGDVHWSRQHQRHLTDI